MPESSVSQFLSHLRFSVLASGERLPERCWSSTGLSEAGQLDLKAVFLRTSVTAAISHATLLAKSHHDDRTRATGVYHLFRLPTDLEASIHRSIMDAEQAGELEKDVRHQA